MLATFRVVDVNESCCNDAAMTRIEEIMYPQPGDGEIFSAEKAFGQAGPFELEIGCGKGTFLLRRAKEHPDIRMLGIEWANKYYQYTADRMARWGIKNVRVMRTDASDFVINHLDEQCLSALHIFHPDPWPKARHHKRRLIQAPFINAAIRALVPGGRWSIQTDHAEYFEWITERMEQAMGIEKVEYDDPQFGIVEATAQTNFEIKYRKEGRAIYSLAFRKTQ